MRKETKKKVRILGAVLFFLYLLALTYFLFFAEGYGRSVEGRMYAYNLHRLHSVWDDPAGHMAENGESFTDPAS